MRKYFLPTVIVCVLVLAAVSVITGFWNDAPKINVTRVGFVYSEDESTPYTANFAKAQHALEDEFGDKVLVLTKSNVLNRESEQPMRELIREGVKILFINMEPQLKL